MNYLKPTLFLFFSLLFLGCNNDDEDDNPVPPPSDIDLDIKKLASLASDRQYEAWLVVDNKLVSVGTFNVDAAGNPTKTNFPVDRDTLEKASQFVLTVEPFPDPDPAPTKVKLLAGDFSQGTAIATTNASQAIGDYFSAATGKYILATPSTTTTQDEESGLWFMDNSGANNQAGLDLPDLPSNWQYEGWVIFNDTPVSTGKFIKEDSADYANPYSGTAGTPNFPGEDFVQNAPSGLNFPTSLKGKTVVVSVEPKPDYSPQPFQLKPLSEEIPQNAITNQVLTITNQATGTFPQITVTK